MWFNLLFVFEMFFLICKLYMSGMYIMPYLHMDRVLLRVFSINIHKKCKSNFLWSRNDTILVCKLYLSNVWIKILTVHKSEIFGNIYDRSVAIVLGTVFFSTFWILWKLFFNEKMLYSCFLFIQKTAELVLENIP